MLHCYVTKYLYPTLCYVTDVTSNIILELQCWSLRRTAPGQSETGTGPTGPLPAGHARVRRETPRSTTLKLGGAGGRGYSDTSEMVQKCVVFVVYSQGNMAPLILPEKHGSSCTLPWEAPDPGSIFGRPGAFPRGCSEGFSLGRAPPGFRPRRI